MSYIDKSLSSGEKVIHHARLHKVVFMWPVIWTALGFLLIRASTKANNTTGIGALIVAVGVFMILTAFIRYLTSEFAITNKRVVLKTGLIRRQVVELFLSKIESMGADQSILGRILNYGTLVVSGTGGGYDGFPKVADPMTFRKRLMEEIEKNH